MPLQELNYGKVTTIHELRCCMKKPQHFVEVVRRIGSRKWRSCEESAFGSGFTVTKCLPKVEVMWRIGFWKRNSLWRSICPNWRSCEELFSIEVEFTVTKHLPKVKVMWRINFWKWYSLWRNVCQKWRLCEESASGSGIHQWRNFVKIYVHRMNISHRAYAGLALTFINRTYTLHSMYESRTRYSILSRVSFCFAN
jgi:hypothetical protein